MPSLSLSISLSLLIIMIIIIVDAFPYNNYGTMFMSTPALYSKRLNLHSGIYGSGYTNNHLLHYNTLGGSRYGQGFVGNPGIGIRQSSETLANVYPQMTPSSSLSFGISPSLYGLSSPYYNGGLSSSSSSSLMMYPTHSSYYG